MRNNTEIMKRLCAHWGVVFCFLSDKTCDGVMTLFEEKAKYDNT
jgi:hypothetical protein